MSEINQHIRQGSLLISEPFMPDPNFKRSVVLMTEHREEGSVGYILNQKSNLFLKDLIQDCWQSELPIYIGGPVAGDTLHFIHRAYDRLQSGTQIFEDVYWGGNFESLKLLINHDQIHADELKFFVGYSGWEPDQLGEELQQKSWILTNQYPQTIAFESQVDELWKEVVLTLGPKFAHLANFPENPMWN
ncbi:MAG: hypothetical protein RI924_1235 [Bacteroidota bacterium]|jgi:putative transcriptional regulator